MDKLFGILGWMDKVLGILGWLALAPGSFLLLNGYNDSNAADTMNGLALISASVGLFAFASIIKLLKEIKDTVATTQKKLLKEIRDTVAATKKG
jgi:hypothetical protein